MDLTQSNYANQWKRLSKDSNRANFILIYYSLAIIIYSLSVKFYPEHFNEIWSSYSGLILSIIVLIYSIINSKAGYPERIAKIEVALNEIKSLKREVGELPKDASNASCSATNGHNVLPRITNFIFNKNVCLQCQYEHTCTKLENLKEKYENIVSNTEMRDDLDFYYTIRHLCKKHHVRLYSGKMKRKFDEYEEKNKGIIEEIRGYISENNPCMQCIHVIFLKLYHFALYVAPVIIFIAGIINYFPFSG